MAPVISAKQENNGELFFRISNIHVSFVNALRRTLMTDIPTAVFKTFPHDENDCRIRTNTSQFNNELIKQRLSCIPIHLTDLTLPVHNYVVKVKHKNEGPALEYVTTEHFKIWNEALEKYVPDEKTRLIFPANKKLKTYIDFLRLRPAYLNTSNKTSNGEEIDLECRMSIHTAKTNAMFNVASLITYSNTLVSKEEMNRNFEKYEIEAKKNETYTDQEADTLRQDWFALNAKRHFVSNSFDFRLASLGVYQNSELIILACDIISSKLAKMLNGDSAAPTYSLEVNDVFARNCFDLVLFNEDYTIGKILEHIIFNTFVQDDDTISYVSFIKEHPHDVNSKVRFVYKDDGMEHSVVIEKMNGVFQMGIDTMKKIKAQFVEV